MSIYLDEIKKFQFVIQDVTKFELNLIFLIKPFRYMRKKSKQKLKYRGNEKSF